MQRLVLEAALFIASVAVGSGTAAAQPTPSNAAGATMEGVSLGEPMSQVRDNLGDPLKVVTISQGQIWRYLEHGGALYLDVLPQNNVVRSITVVRRFDDSSYTDDRGLSFGSDVAAVQAKIGAPTRQSTNSDDGSVDLWYVGGDVARIYEFYAGKLGFVQIFARPGSPLTAGNGEEPTVPADGSSVASAIRIRPSTLIGDSMWIDAFLATNSCDDGGHWKETSTALQADKAANDPLAYMVVHASCTTGNADRTFYFDTHGAAATATPKPAPPVSPPR